MGAKIEHDMRNEIFEHYQKLSFTFFDNQKVGQLLSRITSDLFDISELLHHGPEDVTISLIKFIGSFLILVNINGTLTVITFAFIPVIAVYAFLLNRRRSTLQDKRARIADTTDRSRTAYPVCARSSHSAMRRSRSRSSTREMSVL